MANLEIMPRSIFCVFQHETAQWNELQCGDPLSLCPSLSALPASEGTVVGLSPVLSNPDTQSFRTQGAQGCEKPPEWNTAHLQ